ncbi:hypothetical protein KIN20_027057 [Parelaphostrongylus tenuis]|uniref:BZIP domain-containing protein n=1 Tax=Parelaphostrongylus tenuis TaxID=148309 RepID=A0AAD5QYX4_PARTN|nr:hypothetical protein KIN20_027057 [Parelaphostrongylus tenuis]
MMIFLRNFFDLDQWKSDTSSPTEENSEGQLNSIGNDSESIEIIDAMEWIDKFEPEEIAENVNSTSSLNYLDNDAQRQVDDLLEQAASVVDWKAWSSYLNDSVDYELDGCPNAIEIKDNVPFTAEDSMGNTASNSYLNDNVNIEFDNCTNNERNKVKDEGLLSLVGNMDENAAEWLVVLGARLGKCYLNNNVDVDFDDCLSTSEVEDDGSLSFVGDAIRNNATWNRDLSDNENVELEPCSSTNKIEAGGQLLMRGDTIEDTDAKLSEGIVVPKSGPLTWLPSMEDVNNCNFVSSGKKRINIVTNLPRRRGVKMKPLGDEETNRRRLLNRKAALRYRERKRMRQNEQKEGIATSDLPK